MNTNCRSRSLGLVALTMITTATISQAAPVEPATAHIETAVLAGGCFWGVEAVFEHVKGVRSVVSGYAGGDASTAKYERVGSGQTGHAESVQIVFEPNTLPYGEILRIFFSVAHDPTQLNRQGPDVGSQYRSAIFYVDDAQKEAASKYIAQLNESHRFRAPIVTQVGRLHGFYPAEDYHQDFIARNPHYPYVVVNDLPKIRHLKQLFPDAYRESNAPTSYTAL